MGGGTYYNLHRWYQAPTGRYNRPDPVTASIVSDSSVYGYALGNPLRLVDPLGLFTVDGSCDSCVHPILARDNRNLTSIISRETSAWCRSRLSEIVDINLRDCIEESCIKGRVVCDNSCGNPADLGYTRFGGRALAHWLRRSGIVPIIRTAVLCSNNSVNFAGEAGNTVIHEWAHGCGYDADDEPVPGIPGIPDVQ